MSDQLECSLPEEEQARLDEFSVNLEVALDGTDQIESADQGPVQVMEENESPHPIGSSPEPVTAEENDSWEQFTDDRVPDDIDALDPVDYYPLPELKDLEKRMSQVAKAGLAVQDLPYWGGLGKEGEEYSQKLLEHAIRIRTDREARYKAGPSLHSAGIGDPYIESLGKEINVRVMAAKAQLYEIGYMACLAKEKLKHKEFLPWVKTLSLSKTSVLNAMRVYRACAGMPELIRYFTHTQLYTLCAPAFPQELRDLIFVSRPKSLPSSAAQIAKLGRQFKNSPLPLQEPAIVKLFARRAHGVAYRFLEREVREVWQTLDKKIQRFERVAQEQTPEAFAVTNGVERKCYEKVLGIFRRFCVKLEETMMELSPEPEEDDQDEELAEMEEGADSGEVESATDENSSASTADDLMSDFKPEHGEDEGNAEAPLQAGEGETAEEVKSATVEKAHPLIFRRTVPSKGTQPNFLN